MPENLDRAGLKASGSWITSVSNGRSCNPQAKSDPTLPSGPNLNPHLKRGEGAVLVRELPRRVKPDVRDGNEQIPKSQEGSGSDVGDATVPTPCEFVSPKSVGSGENLAVSYHVFDDVTGSKAPHGDSSPLRWAAPGVFEASERSPAAWRGFALWAGVFVASVYTCRCLERLDRTPPCSLPTRMLRC